ncbi:hypothetical protein BDV59DRAFT_113342 [Aspergillus ambiguus]|uniref:uncharacterized protein n=1 Tax=Aspergillus ambiguus TaxID=176160 RepID=UPI003CCE4EF1
MRQMKIPVGETVAIQGMGGLGHLAIQYANQFGYRVVAISCGAAKEKFARDLGAHHYIDPKEKDAGEALQKLGGAALIVTTASDITPLMKGLAVVGKLLVLSIPGELPVDIGLMLRYGLSVHSWPSGHAIDSEEAIAFTELRGINCMVETFRLERANEASDAMLKGDVRFRAVITME